MSHSPSSTVLRRSWPASFPIYYGWINAIVASVAMSATLPGRTHGLGLITEPLLSDLAMDRLAFARINVAATLIGATFCVPTGWLIDRWGVRSVLSGITLALGISVIGMSACQGPVALAAALVLVRGFGQRALSLASMAAIGKWFRARLGPAMGLFAVLLTFGFIGGVLALGEAVRQSGWREAWRSMGYAILALVPVFWLLTRNTPEESGMRMDLAATEASVDTMPQREWTLRQAILTASFWGVVLGSCAFNLVWAGVTLFNESILAEHGLGSEFAVQIMAILTGVGLLANLVAGALATRERILLLLGGGLALLAAGLFVFPMLGGAAGARWYAVAMGLSGGVVTVVFFASWGHLFGRAQLGRIQGAAQLATVLASATGPVLFAEGRAITGSYSTVMFALAGVVGLLAFWVLTVGARYDAADSDQS